MFSRFEWMMAFRYLRARRQEGFISVIAWFSLFGIALGVATLIIVMSVMNGFEKELQDRILGVVPHALIHSNKPIANYPQIISELNEDETALLKEITQWYKENRCWMHKGFSSQLDLSLIHISEPTRPY